MLSEINQEELDLLRSQNSDVGILSKSQESDVESKDKNATFSLRKEKTPLYFVATGLNSDQVEEVKKLVEITGEFSIIWLTQNCQNPRDAGGVCSLMFVLYISGCVSPWPPKKQQKPEIWYTHSPIPYLKTEFLVLFLKNDQTGRRPKKMSVLSEFMQNIFLITLFYIC